ncbi:MAG TPA: J domain-containing protein [Kofleriaceae bacterium]|nr:J domain-containing protein [Kofleriaceae bacterium]
MRDHPSLRRELVRGELVRLLYRLGRQSASGVLTISSRGSAAPPEVFVLRRGLALDRSEGAHGAGAPARRTASARLARLAAADELALVFEGGVTAVIPPGASRGVSLAGWARAHLEQQLDSALAEALVRELAGVRLLPRPELLPEPADEADRRMLAAMAQPRRLDQIWPLARTPRFRLLAFVHFLRAVGALEVAGVAADRSAPAPAARAPDPRRLAALRTLGIDAAADPDDVKRAYRRLARALHPDLQPDADAERRRALERRFAEVTAAYEALAPA